MRYIYISYDAISELATNRFYQSYDYDSARKLIEVIKNQQETEISNNILSSITKNGLVISSHKIDKSAGIIFDLNTFAGFIVSTEFEIISILQKTLKFAIRYFQKIPTVTCEKAVPETTFTYVYPFPFSARNGSTRVVIDRNSAKEASRKDRNILTAFYFGNDERYEFDQSLVTKVIAEIDSLNIKTRAQGVSNPILTGALNVIDLDSLPISIDSQIGFDNWNHYLTISQRNFINSPIKGPERIEGAAGTGKTLSMVLKCIKILKEKIQEDEEIHLIFITHSIATKKRIIDIFSNNWIEFELYLEDDKSREKQSICVTTLQEWSANHLGTNSIVDDEYLDKDASDSKIIQLMYIEQALDQVMSIDWNTYKLICSDEFISFITNTHKDSLLELLQQEIGVIIKGRASSDFDKYKELNRSEFSIPLKYEADKSFIFEIFSRYQKSLESVGQFDSDDIILTALGQINTPIWNRRRIKEGYDVCFIDEAHLFNINELSIFHYINKPNSITKIIFAVDRSQAIIDTGIDYNTLDNVFKIDEKTIDKVNLSTVFRSSPDIVTLAFDILSDGVTLFTNFINPYEFSTFNFTHEDELKCQFPKYYFLNSDDLIIDEGIKWAEKFVRLNSCSRSKVAIVCTSPELLSKTIKTAKRCNKPVIELKSRSDGASLRTAIDDNKFIIGDINQIGGLEFEAVAILGVDNNRVPPRRSESDGAYHYMNYAWHNRLYVAISRAQYAVALFGLNSTGESPILRNAISNGSLSVERLTV